MKKYKLTADENVVQNTETTAFIPNDERNRDWREYQKWLLGLAADGEDLGTGANTPDPQFAEGELEAIALREAKQVINEKIAEETKNIAIDSLILKGELPIDYKG